MQKGKIIRTIMGELLEPLGFTLKAIPKDKVWEFSRTIKNCEKKDIIQFILIQGGQWDKRVYLNLRTSAYGHSGWYRINCFVPECTSDHLTYQTEDDFNKAIEVFVNFIQDFGLDFFNIISIDMPREDLTKKDHINIQTPKGKDFNSDLMNFCTISEQQRRGYYRDRTVLRLRSNYNVVNNRFIQYNEAIIK